MASTKRWPKSKENLSRLMADYYMKGHGDAESGKFVVWVAIIVPIELLKGFEGLVVAVPENHSAMCAAKGIGASQAEKAEECGYSMDLCSYARIDMGTVFSGGEGSPSMGLPMPDLLISNTNNCSHLVKWFDVYHRQYNIPHFVLDVPFAYTNQKKEDLDYIIRQFKDMIALIEEMSGLTWDIDRVREAVRYSDEGNAHWKRFVNLAMERPSPITAFDSFLQMAPYITAYRGTKELADHMRLLADEAIEQMNTGMYPIPEEKYRLLWDNIAPWHQLRRMYQRLSDINANLIYASYTSCMGTVEGQVDRYLFESDDPLVDLARVQNSSVCPYGLALRTNAMDEIIDRFSIDGVVFASNRSCKPYSLMQIDLMRHVKNRHDVPAVMIDVDHADVRKYSEENVFVKLEALIEEIDANRDA